MKVLSLVYPGMTLLDLVGPIQAWSVLAGFEVQYAWHHSGAVPTDCGLSVQATHRFEDTWTDPDVLFVGGGAKPTLDLLSDSATIAFLADRGSRARWVCSVCTGSLATRGGWTVAGLPCRRALGCPGSPQPIWRRAQQRTCLRRPQSTHRRRHHSGHRLRHRNGRAMGRPEHGTSRRAAPGIRAPTAVWDGTSRAGRSANFSGCAHGAGASDDRCFRTEIAATVIEKGVRSLFTHA
jgi:putative intracellular protease/amidase